MRRGGRQGGFSYLDVLIGVSILLVGVLALVGAMAASVVRSRHAERQLVAKQYASSTIETIFTARDIAIPGFGFEACQNVTEPAYATTDGGIFLNQVHDIRTDAGPDRLAGTADDTGGVVPGLKRQITIVTPAGLTNADYATIRQINVTIIYTIGNAQRQERLSCLIANYDQRNH